MINTLKYRLMIILFGVWTLALSSPDSLAEPASASTEATTRAADCRGLGTQGMNEIGACPSNEIHDKYVPPGLQQILDAPLSPEICAANPAACCKKYFKDFSGLMEPVKGAATMSYRVWKKADYGPYKCCIRWDGIIGGWDVFAKNGRHLGRRTCEESSLDPCAVSSDKYKRNDLWNCEDSIKAKSSGL